MVRAIEALSPQETAAAGSRPLAPEPDIRTDPGEQGDHLRHIICITCYPAFDGAREAPHDAVCVCGKRIHQGDRRNPTGAHCVLCDELWRYHNDTAHGPP